MKSKLIKYLWLRYNGEFKNVKCHGKRIVNNGVDCTSPCNCANHNIKYFKLINKAESK